MKKIYTFIALSFAFLITLSAQVHKGDWSISGSFSVSNSWSESAFSEGFGIGAEFSIGYLLSDHWMIGISPLDQSEFEGISPQVRYFFNPASEKNIYFIDALGGYDFSDDRASASLSLGFNRFVGENLSLETSAGYLIRDDIPNILQVGLGIRSFISSESWNGRKQASSRFGKGSYLIGLADLDLKFQEDIFQTSFNISSGYFITDRFVLGLRDAMSLIRYSELVSFNFDFWRHELAAFGRYYLQTSGRRVVPFTELGIGFNHGSTESDDNYKVQSSRWLAEARLGANVFITPEMAFEFAVVGRQQSRTNAQYDYINRDLFPEDLYPETDGELMDRAFSLGLQVGIQFFLRQD